MKIFNYIKYFCEAKGNGIIFYNFEIDKNKRFVLNKQFMLSIHIQNLRWVENGLLYGMKMKWKINLVNFIFLVKFLSNVLVNKENI